MEDTPITKKQKDAFALFYEMPIPTKHFYPIMGFLVEEPMGESKGDFTRTLKFIREHKLRKGKIMKWLEDHQLSCDHDFFRNVLAPMLERIVNLNPKIKEEALREIKAE